MDFKEIEESLRKTFEDYKLSKDEKFTMSEIFEGFSGDLKLHNFSRNKAFEIVREHLRESDEFHNEAVKWLERIVRAIDASRPQPDTAEVDACFSPGTACASRLISLINGCRKSIDVCVFTISDDQISAALVKAHKRGVAVRIISDDDKSQDMGSDINRFIRSGLNVRMDNDPSHMHHKFAIFDRRTLVNGSFNWTRSASKYNQEDIVINSNEALIGKFLTVFDGLWNEYKESRS